MIGYVPTVDRTADMFTKALSASRLLLLRSKRTVSSLTMTLKEVVRDNGVSAHPSYLVVTDLSLSVLIY